MRILYHHRTLADGAEGIHIAEMVKAFRGLGHEVRISGPAAGREAGGRRRAVTRVRALVPQACFELGTAGYNVPEYLHLGREIDRFGPDLVYKRHARNDVAALTAARRRGIPSVLEVNCLYTEAGYLRFEPVSLAPLARAMERRALESATVVVAVSSPLASQIAGMSAARPLVMPNGVDPDRFDLGRARPAAVRDRLGLASAFVIGWTGILREWHGLEILLEALVLFEEATLLIVGDGPARADVERRAAELGVSHRVVVTGRVAHAAMPDHIAAMDAAVVADERTGVASPMKLLEYMAMERAVVAPRLPNVADLITDETDGLLFTPGDSRHLALVLRRVAAEAALRERLGRHARDTVMASRNWRRNAEAVLAAIGPPHSPGTRLSWKAVD
jgi:glycosyltransferase involved in cell wall biosynthesis